MNILISGPMGSGKSVLSTELGKYLIQKGHKVLHVREFVIDETKEAVDIPALEVCKGKKRTHAIIETQFFCGALFHFDIVISPRNKEVGLWLYGLRKEQ